MKTNGVMIVSTIAVHQRAIHEHTDIVRDWIVRMAHRSGASGPIDSEAFMANHPIFGLLAGVAVGILEGQDGIARLTGVKVACGKEREALELLNQAIAEHTGVIVVHGGSDTPPLQFALGRMFLSGMRLLFELKTVQQNLIDMAETVAPYKRYSIPPWPVACEALGVGSWDHPQDLTVLATAYRRGNRAILGTDLLTSLEATSSLYLKIFGGGRLVLERLPYDGSVLEA